MTRHELFGVRILDFTIRNRLIWDDLGLTQQTYGEYLVGGLEHDFYFSIQLGMSSSQFDELIFFRGVAIPPTRYGDLKWRNDWN